MSKALERVENIGRSIEDTIRYDLPHIKAQAQKILSN